MEVARSCSPRGPRATGLSQFIFVTLKPAIRQTYHCFSSGGKESFRPSKPKYGAAGKDAKYKGKAKGQRKGKDNRDFSSSTPNKDHQRMMVDPMFMII